MGPPRPPRAGCWSWPAWPRWPTCGSTASTWPTRSRCSPPTGSGSAALATDNELAIRCAALAPHLAARRPRPRWKSAGASHQNLRWFRTTLLGRQPGWAVTPAPVGPWRPVRLLPWGAHQVVGRWLETRLVAPAPGETRGSVSVELRCTAGGGAVPTASFEVGGVRAPLDRGGRRGPSGGARCGDPHRHRAVVALYPRRPTPVSGRRHRGGRSGDARAGGLPNRRGRRPRRRVRGGGQRRPGVLPRRMLVPDRPRFVRRLRRGRRAHADAGPRRRHEHGPGPRWHGLRGRPVLLRL